MSVFVSTLNSTPGDWGFDRVDERFLALALPSTLNES